MAGILSYLTEVDWQEVFLPRAPVLEIVVRMSIVNLFLFGLLRLVLTRESGSLGITDLFVVVLIADAPQNAMADNYLRITDGRISAMAKNGESRGSGGVSAT